MAFAGEIFTRISNLCELDKGNLSTFSEMRYTKLYALGKKLLSFLIPKPSDDKMHEMITRNVMVICDVYLY